MSSQNNFRPQSNNFIRQSESKNSNFELKKKLLNPGPSYGYQSVGHSHYNTESGMNPAYESSGFTSSGIANMKSNTFLKSNNIKTTSINTTNNQNSSSNHFRTINSKSNLKGDNNTSLNNSSIHPLGTLNNSYLTTSQNQGNVNSFLNSRIPGKGSKQEEEKELRERLMKNIKQQKISSLSYNNTSNTTNNTPIHQTQNYSKVQMGSIGHLDPKARESSGSKNNNYINSSHKKTQSTMIGDTNYHSFLNNDNIPSNHSKLKNALSIKHSNNNTPSNANSNISSKPAGKPLNVSLGNNKYSRNLQSSNSKIGTNSTNSNYLFNNNHTYLTPSTNIPNVNVNVSHIRIDVNSGKNNKSYNNTIGIPDDEQSNTISYPISKQSDSRAHNPSKISEKFDDRRAESKSSYYCKENEDNLLKLESQLNNFINSSDKLKDSDSSSYIKAFTIYKKLFDDIVINIPEHNRILKKASYGFNDIFQNMILKIKDYKSRSEDLDDLTKSKFK